SVENGRAAAVDVGKPFDLGTTVVVSCTAAQAGRAYSLSFDVRVAGQTIGTVGGHAQCGRLPKHLPPPRLRHPSAGPPPPAAAPRRRARDARRTPDAVRGARARADHTRPRRRGRIRLGRLGGGRAPPPGARRPARGPRLSLAAPWPFLRSQPRTASPSRSTG